MEGEPDRVAAARPHIPYNLFITCYFYKDISPTKTSVPSNISLGRRIPALLLAVFEKKKKRRLVKRTACLVSL